MNARINEATISGFAENHEPASETLNYAQNAILSELPGLVFGLLTLTWIVSALVGLA